MLAILTPDEARLTWTSIAVILGTVAASVLIIWALGRLAPRRYTGAAGNALMRAEIFFRPSREQVLEAKQYEVKQDGESGEPPHAHSS